MSAGADAVHAAFMPGNSAQIYVGLSVVVDKCLASLTLVTSSLCYMVVVCKCAAD
jgi:hypothetical protein